MIAAVIIGSVAVFSLGYLIYSIGYQQGAMDSEVGEMNRSLSRIERGRRPNPVSGRPMSENPWGVTFAPEYVEGLRSQGYDIGEMEDWVEAPPEET